MPNELQKITEDRKWVVVKERESIYFSEISDRAVGTVLLTHKEERGVPWRVIFLNNSFFKQFVDLLLNHLPLAF